MQLAGRCEEILHLVGRDAGEGHVDDGAAGVLRQSLDGAREGEELGLGVRVRVRVTVRDRVRVRVGASTLMSDRGDTRKDGGEIEGRWRGDGGG